MLPLLPGDLGVGGAVVQVAGEDEEVVGEAVEPDQDGFGHRFGGAEGEYASLCAAADCARHVCVGGSGGASGEDEFADLGGGCVEGVNACLEPFDLGFVYWFGVLGTCGICGKYTTYVEEEVLDCQELRANVVGTLRIGDYHTEEC